MSSIRTKTTLLTVSAIVIAMTVATLFGVLAIKNYGSSSSEQTLRLMCETGEKNLDYYFMSVSQSVEMVTSFVYEDLTGISDEELAAHLERARIIFERTANKTSGVLTYYYRIDPEISDTVKGFWYTDLTGEGFVEHEVTDITLYDTSDTTRLVWFTVPRATGKPIWLPPYVTDNLDVRVISYNEPIYFHDVFIGVLGIEIDCTTMSKQVDNIKLFENGYAFINDEEGRIVYHPRLGTGEHPIMPEGLMSESPLIEYTYEGVDKLAVCRQLSNGMRLNVCVPVSEINGAWHKLINTILIASIVLLLLFTFLALNLSGHFTKPLRELTEAAKKVNEGNYDLDLKYEGNDEVGILTRTFNQLIHHLKVYISDLNSLAYPDPLTSVRKRGAYEIHLRRLQDRLDDPEDAFEFAIGVFCCDSLKYINDHFGREKGDSYLKAVSSLVCGVFQHSPVFRSDSDEFSVILMNDDLGRREELLRLFEEKSRELDTLSGIESQHVSVAMGVAVCDPSSDGSVSDVVQRAGKLMSVNKKNRKSEKKA